METFTIFFKKCNIRSYFSQNKYLTLFDNVEVFAPFSLKISSKRLKILFFRMKICFFAFLAILKRNMTLHLCWYNEASIFYVTLNLTKMMLMKGNKSHNFRRSLASFLLVFSFASPQQGEIKYYFPFVSGECSLFILRCMWQMHERFISEFSLGCCVHKWRKILLSSGRHNSKQRRDIALCWKEKRNSERMFVAYLVWPFIDIFLNWDYFAFYVCLNLNANLLYGHIFCRTLIN